MCEIDTWQIWDVFEGKRLFTARHPEDRYSARYHLAQMMAILGPPPLELIRKSEISGRFWDRNGKRNRFYHRIRPTTDSPTGKWIADVPIPNISLESEEHRLDGEEKELFLSFMRKMLQWRPEDRSSCRDIFFDEWLLGDLIEAGVIERPPRK